MKSSCPVRVAFFVNPLAGYGLLQNLKDSADPESFDPEMSVSAKRAIEFLNLVEKNRLEITVPDGMMGTGILGSALPVHNVFSMHSGETSAEDTRRFVRSLKPGECDILVFVGGDGTARDILESLDPAIPVIGVPSGLKMYSGVFAQDPARAALVLNNFDPSEAEFTEAEILDMDVNSPEKRVEHFGELRVPVIRGMISQGKTEYAESDPEDLIDFIEEQMEPGRYYFISTGHTCKKIIQRLGYETSPLGIDVIRDGRLIEEDLDRERILHYASLGESSLITSPLGGQNFLFGRANRQIDSTVVNAIGFENVIVISGPEKLNNCRDLLVDLPGCDVPAYVRVISGYGQYRMVPIRK